MFRKVYVIYVDAECMLALYCIGTIINALRSEILLR